MQTSSFRMSILNGIYVMFLFVSNIFISPLDDAASLDVD